MNLLLIFNLAEASQDERWQTMYNEMKSHGGHVLDVTKYVSSVGFIVPRLRNIISNYIANNENLVSTDFEADPNIVYDENDVSHISAVPGGGCIIVKDISATMNPVP